MNEADTRAELIEPQLRAAGWGLVDDSFIRREYYITAGKIQPGGTRSKPLKADYVLEYKNRKLATIEAKSDELEVAEGVMQAKLYAGKMELDFTYAANGHEIYEVSMRSGTEGIVATFPSPDELWQRTFGDVNEWQARFNAIPFEFVGGSKDARYYQEIAVNNALTAIANNRERILLTLATGTGKTFIAFQIAWKLFQSRWNLQRDAGRRPRILFLADRNILADQAFNAFEAFGDDARKRITPGEISAHGQVPTNASIFFTIFQTFMSGGSTGSPTEEGLGLREDGGGSAGSPTLKASSATLEAIDVGEISNAHGYMYILECSDGSFYTGSTTDLRRRLRQHEDGEGAEHTRRFCPVRLVYYETFDRIDLAFNREKQIQGWSRAKKLALITGDLDLLRKLSKSKKALGPKVAEPVEAYFGQYPQDFFDLIVIDECHRGGANDDSTWRAILEYFSPAVQIGLTATPKRDQNIDTYDYFGEPVYTYSLKDGIADGFLTPFKVRRIWTTLDEYRYVPDDKVLAGEVEADRVYDESDFNKIIVMEERERKRVRLLLDEINQSEKTLAFGATQSHAAMLRDLINQNSTSTDPLYCVRVAADDGPQGEQYLREFQDNEKTIPTILTTSQKLSTGVDARNIRHIALMRPVNSMIEFKQIIGRGTRLYEGKDYFTIYDFVGAYHHFADPEWDGEPIEPEPVEPRGPRGPRPEPPDPGPEPPPRPEKIRIKLADGKERQIQHMASTSFMDADGNVLSANEFIEKLFGVLPSFFTSEEDLRRQWSDPHDRRKLLDRLSEVGFGKEQLSDIQKLIDAEKSDVFDVLEYVGYAVPPLTRTQRATDAQQHLREQLKQAQQEFIDFVLNQYVQTGVYELDIDKLPQLLTLKYHALDDATRALGDVQDIRSTFIEFQKHLYARRV